MSHPVIYNYSRSPRIDWRREAPPVNSWGLCPSTATAGTFPTHEIF
ncbi:MULTISPECIES: hypothetical protein [Pseudanabaena]|uniref:Uncharacterized protein n=1 Tax=Pseudanabaena catenata USMAC16 TaxID=1855837 RepID=A0A9X4MCR4_9CYAN|nr:MULTISPECIES: hypothetical protein [Pseudanabaena]MDG3496998.1 hypothetical protein [Pseudanabaena catenata USMAC16]